MSEPCHEAWSAMTPRGEGRHCASCDKTVVDLTRLTRAQAEATVKAHGGALCGRLALDARGEPVFRPETARLAPAVLAAGLLAACGVTDPPPPPPAHPAPVAPPAEPAGPASEPADLRRFGGSVATGTMMPISALPPAPPPPVPAIQIPSGQDEPVTPTPEQRRLTRRKQLARTPVITHTLGVIRCPTY